MSDPIHSRREADVFTEDAQWIGLEGGWNLGSLEEHRSLPARYLRREFELERKPLKAVAKVCGLGMYDFHLNGQLVDDRLFAPGYTYFSKRALYVEYDVSAAVREGGNVIGIVLGNGRFFAPRVASPTEFTDFGFPRLLFQLDLEYADGHSERIVSDDNWRVTDQGPIRANNEYDGEFYDARMELPGWDSPGFDATAWENATIMEPPTARLDRHDYPPDRVTERLKPIAIDPAPGGGWIVDFGENFYGNVQCRVSGSRGTLTSWTAAYSLDEKGALRIRDNRDAKSTDTYILKGEGEEVWSPRFRGQGMRRIHVTEWPGEPKLKDFTGLKIHADFEARGQFRCSHPQINQLAENIRRGQQMYRRHGCPLDPDRNERQGWLGDIGANTESDFFNWDAISFFKKWLVDIQLDQKPSGQLPDISPAIWPFYSKNIDWPAAYLIIVWNLWKFTGDHSILKQHFPSLVAWIGFVEKELVLQDGTVDENVYTDWCDTSTIGKSKHFSSITSGPFISSAYWAYCVQRVAEIAGLLSAPEAEDLQQKSARAQRGFLERFVDSQTGATPNNSQCELAMLLAMDLVPEDLKDPVSRLLHDAVSIHADGHPTVGLVGMQWLMQGLLAGHCDEAAWQLLTCTTRPSWGYMIEQGATTIWENWDTDSRDPGMNSEALLMLVGNLNSYLYEAIGGIRQMPGTTGFKELRLAPLPIGELTEAEVSFSPPQGTIRSHWCIEAETFRWAIEIPPDTTATIKVPDGYTLSSCQDAYGTDYSLEIALKTGTYTLTAQA